MGNNPSLLSIDPDGISTLPRKGLVTKCKVTNVHDGDTITIIYFIKKGVPFKINLRLEGIDAPEINSDIDLEKEAGMAVMQWLEEKLSEQKYWWVLPKKWDKYGGRIIGTLYCDSSLGGCINDTILDLGFAVSYKGGKKTKWTEDMLEEILMATNLYKD